MLFFSLNNFKTFKVLERTNINNLYCKENQVSYVVKKLIFSTVSDKENIFAPPDEKTWSSEVGIF